MPACSPSTIENAAVTAMTPEQKKQNLRMALILASIAAVFFVGIFVKIVLLGH
jgi:hypothetical protein